MKKEIQIIINELIEKSKNSKIGFPERRFSVKLVELENFNFILFSELNKITLNLWSSENNYSKEIIDDPQPILEIIDDCVEFYPSLIKQYQIKINI